MKTKLMVLPTLIVSMASAGLAEAAVQPVVLIVTSEITYTVPAGKVLLLEHLSASSAGGTPTPRIIVETKIRNISNLGLSTMRWGFPVADKWTEVTLTRPLRIPAGGIVGVYSANNLGYDSLNLMGLLIDTADLYAANVGGSVEQAGVADGVLSAQLGLTSPRPVRLASETSSDLASWAPNATEHKQRSVDPRQWTVQTDLESGSKFMRVVAKAPEKEPPVAP